MRADQALRQAVERLAAAGVASPQWDAEQLVALVTGARRFDLPGFGDITAEQAQRLAGLVDQRAARVPLQHLTGSVGFRYLDIEVGKGVFIPRPESEVVAGLAIDLARGCGDAPLVVDLCSGSGAIPLAIANELPRARVHAVEVDPDALRWLHRNAEARREAGDTLIEVHHADVRGALPALDGTVDVVVSNPPYVAEDELDLVEPEVRDHDPWVALVAGPDGLDVIRDVVAAAERLLRPGGWVVIEHSDRQGESCPALLAARPGWVEITDHPDLTGRPRCTTARREAAA
jgi:release factor glutamine methyltransferase